MANIVAINISVLPFNSYVQMLLFVHRSSRTLMLDTLKLKRFEIKLLENVCNTTKI